MRPLSKPPSTAPAAPPASPALAIAGVSHAYGTRHAVIDASIAVAPGELVCLVGPSGCGKTTLLRLAAGLEELQSGTISIDGRVVAEPGRAVPPERRGVGLVFQDFALFPHLAVAGNVAFGLDGMPRAARRARIEELLQRVGMADRARAWPHQLSGGQQQRVALARALAPAPRVLLLDEPFSGLEVRLREQIRDDTLHVLKHAGAATLMVTHDPEEAMFMADRIAIMRAGRIEQEGSPDAVYMRPASPFVTAFFGQVNEIRGRVREGRVLTPFGAVPAGALAEGAAALVMIRPEALRLGEVEGAPARARVLAARLLGRTSWVHLAVGGAEPAAGPAEGEAGHVHFHARAPGRFLPRAGEILGVRLDPAQAFVFPDTPPQ